MARYRKIDPRIWNDETFRRMSMGEKLSWFAMLTHPSMTPMGAGVFPAALLDDALDLDSGHICVCPCCFSEMDGCTQDTIGGAIPSTIGDGYLERFRMAGMIFRDGALVIIKNFLLYNAPDNANHLAGWIESCEELPRSDQFEALRDHLKSTDDLPRWLFDGLLNPLAEQKARGLRDKLWSRIKDPDQKKINRKKKPSRKPSGDGSGDGARDGMGDAPRDGMGDDSPDPGTGAGTGEGDPDRGTFTTSPSLLPRSEPPTTYPDTLDHDIEQALTELRHHHAKVGGYTVRGFTRLDEHAERIAKVLAEYGHEDCEQIQRGHIIKSDENGGKYRAWPNAYPAVKGDKCEPDWDWIAEHHKAGEVKKVSDHMPGSQPCGEDVRVECPHCRIIQHLMNKGCKCVNCERTIGPEAREGTPSWLRETVDEARSLEEAP